VVVVVVVVVVIIVTTMQSYKEAVDGVIGLLFQIDLPTIFKK